MAKSLFRKPEKKQAGLKVLVYGEEGTGKTLFALSFPKIIMIDTEAGSVFYEGTEQGKNLIGVLNTQSYIEYEDALNEVKDSWEDMGAQTLVTDSMTKIRQTLAETILNVDIKRNKRNGMADADLNSNLSLRSWGKIGEISKKHQNKKIDLSNHINIVDIAQMKKIVDDNQNVIEYRPDTDKSAPYDYDIKLRMAKKETEDGVKFFALVEKDRTNTFKVGDVVENPSFESWSKVLDGKGAKLNTNYTSQQEDDEERYEEQVEREEKPFDEKMQEFASKLDTDKKKEFSELLKENGIPNKLKGLTKNQQKAVLKLVEDFDKK